MKKLLGLILFGALTVAVYTPSEANYRFSIKVINKTGGPINTVITNWVKKPQANVMQRQCWNALMATTPIKINNNGNWKESCKESAGGQKWKRRIIVSFTCGDTYADGARQYLYFPRGSKKWYARDHAVKNGDKYTVTIKKNDC